MIRGGNEGKVEKINGVSRDEENDETGEGRKRVIVKTFRVRLDGGMEKWEDEKLWEDGKVGG